MSNRFAVALLLGALVLAPGFAGAADEPDPLEQLVVETADTPAEHTALAKFYRAKAGKARASAARHKSMGHAYLGGKGMNKQAFVNHCRKITEQYEALSQQFEEMAKMHDEEAKATP